VDTATVDARARRVIYDVTLRTGAPPRLHEIAAGLREPPNVARASLTRLAGARVLVVQPSSGELLMVPPFSAVPTPFLVHTAPHSAYANCAWDALGISVMLREPAHIVSACSCCGDELTIDTSLDTPPTGTAIVHFAVPARHWWDDIVFT
jgi:hypothetical protein